MRSKGRKSAFFGLVLIVPLWFFPKAWAEPAPLRSEQLPRIRPRIDAVKTLKSLNKFVDALCRAFPDTKEGENRVQACLEKEEDASQVNRSLKSLCRDDIGVVTKLEALVRLKEPAAKAKRSPDVCVHLLALSSQLAKRNESALSRDRTNEDILKSGLSGGLLSGTPLPPGAGDLLLDGLTTFVMNRARQELIAMATESLTKDLCNQRLDKNAPTQIRDLFPNICGFSDKAKEAGTLLSTGRLFQTMLVEDLRGLPLHLSAYLAAQAGEGNKVEGPVAACFLSVGDKIGRSLSKRQPAETLLPVVVKQLGEDAYCKKAFEAVKEEWQSGLGYSHKALQLSVGAKLENLTSEESNDLADAVLSKDASRLKDAMAKLKPLVEALSEAAQALSNEKDPAKKPALVKALVGESMMVLHGAIEVAMEYIPEDKTEVRKAIDKALKLLEGTRHLVQGDYAAGISSFVVLLDGLIPQKHFQTLVRISSLVADLSAAKTGDEVATALENAAAPVGTWRQRRKRGMVGVSAQLGLRVGGEQILGVEVPTGLLLGLHAPVGMDFSLPIKGTWTAGVLFQVIDLGTLVSARFERESAQDVMGMALSVRSEPRVGFLQVLAPGAVVYLGLGNSPVVLSGHLSWVPDLREVRVGTGEPSPYGVLQFGGSLSVDIPILPLHSW